MLRKLCLVAVSVLLSTQSPVAQLASATIVTMTALGAHSWWKPFEADTLNSLEMGAHVVAGVTIVAGQYIAAAEGGTSSDASVAATVIVLLANAAFGAAAAGLVVHHACTTVARAHAARRQARRKAALATSALSDVQSFVGANPMTADASPEGASSAAVSVDVGPAEEPASPAS